MKKTIKLSLLLAFIFVAAFTSKVRPHVTSEDHAVNTLAKKTGCGRCPKV